MTFFTFICIAYNVSHARADFWIRRIRKQQCDQYDGRDTERCGSCASETVQEIACAKTKYINKSLCSCCLLNHILHWRNSLWTNQPISFFLWHNRHHCLLLLLLFLPPSFVLRLNGWRDSLCSSTRWYPFWRISCVKGMQVVLHWLV